MKMKAHFSFIALTTILLAVWGCEKESQQLATKAVKPAVKHGEYDYLSMQYPRNVLGDQADPSRFPNGIDQRNPLTNEGATLGRVLFYDENLLPQQPHLLRLLPFAIKGLFRPGPVQHWP
ncbi:MAG: hypothetical protein IPN76_34335 [Saprospiraceae bacterium]|nr:hypothetical protein [Saprospiraceae bacterium]